MLLGIHHYCWQRRGSPPEDAAIFKPAHVVPFMGWVRTAAAIAAPRTVGSVIPRPSFSRRRISYIEDNPFMSVSVPIVRREAAKGRAAMFG